MVNCRGPFPRLSGVTHPRWKRLGRSTTARTSPFVQLPHCFRACWFASNNDDKLGQLLSCCLAHPLAPLCTDRFEISAHRQVPRANQWRVFLWDSGARSISPK
jgi:hypothetical protein